MSLWGAITQTKKSSLFPLSSSTLHLTQITLLEGASATVKFRSGKDGQMFELCRLTEARPNYLCKLIFNRDVRFEVGSSCHAKVSLVGNLRSGPESENSDSAEIEDLEQRIPSKSHSDSSVPISPPESTSITTKKSRKDASKKTGQVTQTPIGNQAQPREAGIILSDKVRNEESFGAQLAKSARTGSQVKPEDTQAKKEPQNSKRDSADSPAVSLKPRSLPGGVRYEIVKVGSGKLCTVGHRVKVKYEGRLAKTGRKFDSGALDFTIGSGDMIKGFDLGVRGMLLQERRRISIPARLGYGKQSVGGIPPNSDLIFEVSLLAVS